MTLLHDLLSLMALLVLIAQRNRSAKRPEPDQLPTGPPDVSLLDLSRRQLSAWRALLAESAMTDAHPEQVAYCRQQVSRLEAEVNRLDQQTG